MRSTLAEIERFLDSALWLDLLEELQVWNDLADEDLIEATDIRKIGVVQGRKEALRYLKQLPQVLKDNKEAELAKEQAQIDLTQEEGE